MTPATLIAQCLEVGITVQLNGDPIRLRGAPDAVRKLAEVVKQHKQALIAYLMETNSDVCQTEGNEPCRDRSPSETASIVDELVTDGLDWEEAEEIASRAAPCFTQDEWLAMIAELDALIERYCSTVKISEVGKASILAARNRQSLASIPATLAWFKTELADHNHILKGSTSCPKQSSK